MIQSRYRPDIYTGDGTTKAFAFTFRIRTKAALVPVTQNQTTGAVTTYTLDTDYTIDDAYVNRNAGGLMTFTTAPADGALVILRRRTPRTQLLDITEGGRFPSAPLMGSLDESIMIHQEHDNEAFVPSIFNLRPAEGSTSITITHGFNDIDTIMAWATPSWTTTVNNDVGAQAANTMTLIFGSPAPASATLVVGLYSAGAGILGIPPTGIDDGNTDYALLAGIGGFSTWGNIVHRINGVNRFRFLNTIAIATSSDATQAIPNNTLTQIAPLAMMIDGDGLFSAGSNGLILKQTGRYMLFGCLSWASNSTGERVFAYNRNSSGWGFVSRVAPNPTDDTVHGGMNVLAFNAADTIIFGCAQVSGGNLNLQGTASQFGIFYLGE